MEQETKDLSIQAVPATNQLDKRLPTAASGIAGIV